MFLESRNSREATVWGRANVRRLGGDVVRAITGPGEARQSMVQERKRDIEDSNRSEGLSNLRRTELVKN